MRYFNGILFVFTLVFLKCAHYSADFGTRMRMIHRMISVTSYCPVCPLDFRKIKSCVYLLLPPFPLTAPCVYIWPGWRLVTSPLLAHHRRGHHGVQHSRRSRCRSHLLSSTLDNRGLPVGTKGVVRNHRRASSLSVFVLIVI